MERVSGPLSPLTLLSAAAYSRGFWTMRKCGEVSCICTCHFPPDVHSMSSTSLPGVIKLPFDLMANIFLCCLFAPLFRHLTLPSLSPLSDSQLVGSHVRSHPHTPTHHNVFFFFFPPTAMGPCDFGIHHSHDQYQILDMSPV